MNEPHFVFGYLPFWIANYGLAIVIWSCAGRFLLGILVAGRHADNYIYRAFCRLTDWAVAGARYLTPAFVHPILHAPIAAFWLYHLRIALFFVLWQAGMTPALAPPSEPTPAP